MIYGLAVSGILLAYYAWKKNTASSDKKSDNLFGSTSSSTNSGTFVDDVPVSLDNFGEGKTALDKIKDSVSQIIEPILGKSNSTQSSGQGQFLES